MAAEGPVSVTDSAAGVTSVEDLVAGTEAALEEVSVDASAFSTTTTGADTPSPVLSLVAAAGPVDDTITVTRWPGC